MEHPENSAEYKALSVMDGVQQPQSVNPYLKKRIQKREEMSVDEIVAGVLSGNITVLSKAITLVESAKPEHQVLAQQVIEKCLPYSGKSIRIGISGVPGAGKSTSINKFGIYLLDNYGGKLAVLAIDPSSELNNGSILGDKTRMKELTERPEAFVRPSPSAGNLGGVARKTRETIILCEAAGYDKMLVETIGVGQNETICQSMVDFFLLLQVVGTGDELQGVKRGIMEMADGIAVNKCDGDNVSRCQQTASELRNALHLFPSNQSGWERQVVTYSGLEGNGIKDVWDMVFSYMDLTKANGYFQYHRNVQNKYWLRETVKDTLLGSFFNDPHIAEHLKAEERLVEMGQCTSFVAADRLIDEYYKRMKK